jgi:hypothetical protein
MLGLVTRLQMTGLKYKIKYCLLHDKLQMKEHTYILILQVQILSTQL